MARGVTALIFGHRAPWILATLETVLRILTQLLGVGLESLPGECRPSASVCLETWLVATCNLVDHVSAFGAQRVDGCLLLRKVRASPDGSVRGELGFTWARNHSGCTAVDTHY